MSSPSVSQAAMKDTLRKCGLFRGLPDEWLKRLAAAADRRLSQDLAD